MIAILWLLGLGVAGPVSAPTSVPLPPAASGPTALLPPAAGGPVALAPAVVLERYAAALRKLREPRVISFDYTLEQTGLKTLAQTHRVFRSGDDERDETLTVDGKRLAPPKVRIFRGRRNRYTLRLLAPLAADYAFAYIGARKNARHLDYLFGLTARTPRAFSISAVAIDGVRFLPDSIDFQTRAGAGAGTIVFGSNARWWVPYFASARATIASDTATERLTFYTYRFPPTLPPSTFRQARRAAPTATLPLPEAAPAVPTDKPALPGAESLGPPDKPPLR